MGTPGKQAFTDNELITVLEYCKGIQSEAARMLGVHRQTVQKRIKHKKRVHDAYEQIIETNIDVAEGKMGELIDAGCPDMIKFYLRCKAKHRGYVERQEYTGAGGGPIEVKNFNAFYADNKED